jgi:cell division protein FtsQ
VKRPDGFDERPEQPVAPEPPAAPPAESRQRVRLADRFRRAPIDDGLEAPPASAPAPSDETLPQPGALPELPDLADDVDGDAPHRVPNETPSSTAASREQRGVSGATKWRGLSAGLSSVAGRFKDLSPDEDFRDPDAPASRTATGLLDPRRPSSPSADEHEVPIGAGVRAAETAREARLARKRRRLVERAEIRRFTRRSRHRRVAWITSGSVLVVLVLAVVVAVYSPLMALTTIKVEGTSRIDRASVQTALDSQLGTPLARVDFGEIKQKLKGFPLIESYVTEEEPPHTLVVTITEREPIVAVKTGSGYDLVDPAGIVVESDPNKPNGMPVAEVDASQLGGGVYRSMTEVVLSLPSTVRSTVTDVTATTADDVTLTLGTGAKVVWGSPDDSTAKATLLAALIKDHDARDPSASVEYDVSAPDNGIIRQQQ